MALNLKNPDVERLAAEVATLTGESKTEAIRRALEERRERLSYRIVEADRARMLAALLEVEVWPMIPRGQLGRAPTRRERAEILGAGA
jgi:antitoxin VapB